MSGSCLALKTLAAQPRSRGTVLYVVSIVGGFISQVNFSFMLIVSELQGNAGGWNGGSECLAA